MTQSKVESSIHEWLRDKPNALTRASRWILASYYNRLPRQLRPFTALHWMSKTALASSAPAVAYYFYASITAGAALGATVAILVAHSVVSFLDAASREKQAKTSQAGTEIMMRLGELLGAAKPRSRSQSEKDDAIRAALGVIEIFVRQVTNCQKGEISVAIATYNGQSSSRMCIKYRNPGNTRPLNRKFDGEGVLGHHACQAGTAPRVVHDIRGLAKDLQRSPTQSEASYRSFFILPLTVTHNGEQRVGGFLSIDSTKPYCFYGSRARIIVVNCQPVIEHIQDLL